MKKINNNKAITLIALVITIIILLILAGVAINALTQTGLFENAKQAKNVTENAKGEENTILGDYENEINKYNIKQEKENSKLDNEGLLGKIQNLNVPGEQTISVKYIDENEEKAIEYSINLIIYNGNLTLDGKNSVEGATLKDNVYEFGNKEKDVATENENAKNMVVLKVNGNLTINEGIILTSCKSENNYGGPKGITIFCDGKIVNNGTISMTARGAKAEGQNVYLWQNTDGSFEYIPATGALGGAEIMSGGSKNVPRK